MTARPDHVLLVFLDGIGLGDADAERNPFLRARLPVLRELLGGVDFVGGAEKRVPPGAPARLAAAIATMGVAGRPQSGTGQTALLTGVNTAEMLGRHFGPWVHTALRPMLAERNLLRRAADAGRSVAFANAYPEGYLRGARGRRVRPAAPPLAAESVAALTRDIDWLKRGDAVASSITNEGWQSHFDPSVPSLSAADAGRNLARITSGAELTLYAHYDTDHAGHSQDEAAAVAALEKVDEFLGGVYHALPAGALLVIASDHGNIEDLSVGHTLNPIPVLAAGPGREVLAGRVAEITDVAPALLGLLGVA